MNSGIQKVGGGLQRRYERDFFANAGTGMVRRRQRKTVATFWNKKKHKKGARVQFAHGTVVCGRCLWPGYPPVNHKMTGQPVFASDCRTGRTNA
jgi:hypothetical protein